MASSPLKLVVNNVEDEETLILKPEGSGPGGDWLKNLSIGTTFLCQGKDTLTLDEFKIINKVKYPEDTAVLCRRPFNNNGVIIFAYFWYASSVFSAGAYPRAIIRTE